MSEPKYYTSIVDLPLSNFINCLVDQNIYALVISGKPTDEELIAAREGIMLEYRDNLADGEGKLHFNLLKEVELLKLDFQKAGMCLQILEAEINFPTIVQPEKRFSDDLNKLTESNFKFDHSKPEEFRKELKRAKARSKSILIKIQLKQSNLDALNKKDNEGAKVTKEYFQSILNTLSLFSKFQLSDTMTTYSFCDWVRKFNLHREFLEKQNKK
jgi:hypothetical protein